MSETTHTPDLLELARARRDAAHDRMTACVNACESIADPETAIPLLIEALTAVAVALESQRDFRLGNADTDDYEAHRKAVAALAHVQKGQSK